MKAKILILTIAFGLCAINKATAQTVASGITGDCIWTLTGPSDNLRLPSAAPVQWEIIIIVLPGIHIAVESKP
jgi:hypothetical protein